MAHFYFILVALLAFAAIVQAFIDIGVLEPCDDCCSPVNALPKPIRMGGVLYGAFAVCSNGYMLLLPDATSPYQRLNNNRDFIPIPVRRTTGSPFIAPFWHDVNLLCEGESTVGYAVLDVSEFSGNILATSVAVDVVPELIMFVSYKSVERYNCPADNNANTFFMILETGTKAGISHTKIFIIYESMTWDRSNLTSFPPTVGWGDGQGNGYQLPLGGPSPAMYLGDLEIVVDNIDGPEFTVSVQTEAELNGINEQALKVSLQQIKNQLNGYEDKEKIAQLESVDKLFQAIQQQKDVETGNTAGISRAN